MYLLYFLKSTRDFQTSRGDQSFQTRMPTEKVFEFLDYHLKPVMKNGESYMRDSGHFLEKIKNIVNLSENATA